MLGREPGRKEGRDRKGREGRRDEGGKRGGTLLGSGWGRMGKSAGPKVAKDPNPTPTMSDKWVSSFQKGNLNGESGIPKSGKILLTLVWDQRKELLGFKGPSLIGPGYIINPVTTCWFWTLHSALQCLRFC